MKSSPESKNGAPPEDLPLPPALSSMWRLCKLGYQHEPRLLVTAFLLALLAALPDALLALWLKLLGDGVLDKKWALVYFAATAIGVSAAATWFLRIVSTRVQRGFRDKVTIALESHVARLQASVATIAHQERPEYLDRLSVLRNQVFVLDHLYMSLFTTCGWILRLGVTVALLMSIHPALVLLAVCRFPPSSRRPGGRPSSGPPRSAGRNSAASRDTISIWPRRRPLAKRCESRGSAAAWRSRDARPGKSGTARLRKPAGDRPVGTRWRGPSSASPMSSPWCSSRAFLKRRPEMSCSYWPREPACRRTLVRRWARSVSCAASGWTAPAGWRGSRTMPNRSSHPPTSPCRRGSRRESASSTFRSPIRERSGSCSRMSIWTFPPAASSPSSARTVRVRRL